MKIYPGMPLVNTATSASTDKIKTKLSPRTQQPNSCWPPPLKPRAYLKPFIEFLRIYSSKAKKVKVFHTFYSLFTGSSPASKSIGHQHIHLLGWSHGWWLLLLLTEQGYILLPWNWSKVDRYYTFVLNTYDQGSFTENIYLLRLPTISPFSHWSSDHPWRPWSGQPGGGWWVSGAQSDHSIDIECDYWVRPPQPGCEVTSGGGFNAVTRCQ